MLKNSRLELVLEKDRRWLETWARKRRWSSAIMAGGNIAMLKKVQVSALTTTLLVWSALASAQTTPGTPAAPGAGTTTTTTADSGMNWLWIIIVLAIIAAAVWYFMRRRRSGTGL
jgi:lysozyme family protein